MDILTLITCAIGLSMDAFAISICKGLSLKKITLKECGIVGLWFGGFQALMPFIGYFLGINFKQYIVSIDHWIAFVLLGIIGINMIRESRQQEETCTTCNENPLEMKEMFLLAIASSIDALAVGITFAFLDVNIGLAVILIGTITFTFSMIGVKMGHVVGSKFKSKAEFAGGVVLILLGLKILLEHLNII